MSEKFDTYKEKQKEKPLLKPEEREAITSRANVRRRQFELKTSLSEMEKLQDSDRYGEVLKRIYKEMTGEPQEEKESPTELKEKADEMEGMAEEENFADLSALRYAKAAQLRFAGGENPRDTMSKSQKLLKEYEIKNPSHLLPHAMLLGLEKQLLTKSDLPEQKNIADAGAKNKELLLEYALVLSENDRQSFLDSLPVEIQSEISLAMDEELSAYLPEKYAKTKEEQKQRKAILNRTQKQLQSITKDLPEKKQADTKSLCRILVNLQGDDSLRVMQEIGIKFGLAKAKNGEQQLLRYEYAKQITDSLIEEDAVKGGILAMKFLGKRDLPENLFSSFFSALLKEKILTGKSQRYFKDKANWPFLRKLIAEYPNQFNTVIDTIHQLPDYNPAKNTNEIFQAMQDLDSLTPIIFDRYRRADQKGKKELARKIKELKPKLFQNQPIRSVLPREDRDILAEMVYLAYQPVGMSFENVKKFIEQLDDQTDDLDEFNFPKNGYPFVMEGGKTFALKKGEHLDEEKMRSYRELFSAAGPQNEEQVFELGKILSRAAKAGSDFKEKELSTMLGLLGTDQQVRNFLKRYQSLDQGNYYNYLNELKELMGVYFSDHYHERLKNFLSANPKAGDRIMKILSTPKRQQILKKKLAKDGEEIDWENLSSTEEAAKALSVFIQTKVLKIARKEIAQATNKFRESEEGEKSVAGRQNLKAYISKNVGSFFAKASAGICTAEDVSLFERKDHFHINIVEDDEHVRGNVQAYIIDEGEKKKSLVLRGFNPNTAFLDKIDPGAFCEAVLKIARQFQTENNLDNLYITEHLTGWHALSNRPSVAQYLNAKYAKKKNRKEYNLRIASSQSVNYIHKV